MTSAALHFLHLSLAPSSLSTYRSGWSAFSRFCSSHHLDTLPLNESTLLLFCSSLALQRISFATIKVYLHAITYFSRLSGFPFSLDTFPRIQFLLRGIRRNQGNSLTRQIRSPITLSHLTALHNHIFRSPDSPDSLMLWAAVTVAFFGLLRASEFTSPSPSSLLPSTLLFQHVSFSFDPDTVLLHLPLSKTDQYGNGATIRIFRLPPPLCPFTAIRAFYTSHPFRSGPFFRFRNGLFLTRSSIVSLLNTVFPSQSSLNTHSFRIGGASALAATGVSDSEIRILGRWSSDSFLRYIRLRHSSIHNSQLRMRFSSST